jgi:HlyD family secretion protein
MGKLIRLLVILVVIGGGIVGVYAWLRGKDSGDGGLKTVDITSGAITEKAIAVGQIKPRLEFKVKSKISGLVKRCFVEVGQVVQAGDPLFEIAPDPTPTELVQVEREVESRRTAFDRAQADFRRIEELNRQGIVARGDLDAAREDFERTRIELARAQDALALTRKGRIEGRGSEMESIVRAPAGGVVLARQVNPGDPVVPLTSYQPGTELATVADMRDLIFQGTVDEIDVGKLGVGVLARIKIGALPDQAVTGRISRIAPQAKEKDGARLFDIELELDPSPGITLRAGYSANADLIIREKTDVLLVPERVVTFEDGGKKAFVEVPGDAPGAEPKKIEITTGLSDGLNVEVVSGLSKGDKVVQRPPKEISGLPG